MENPEWKYDHMPEIMDGKNVSDFIDPDIMDRLEALEHSEDELEAEGYYEDDQVLVCSPLPITTFYFKLILSRLLVGFGR